MFERFNVPNLYITNPNIMSLYANGTVSGFTVDSGEGVTTMMPIYEGYAINRGVQRINIGGQDLTQHLANLLTRRGHHFNTGYTL